MQSCISHALLRAGAGEDAPEPRTWDTSIRLTRPRGGARAAGSSAAASAPPHGERQNTQTGSAPCRSRCADHSLKHSACTLLPQVAHQTTASCAAARALHDALAACGARRSPGVPPSTHTRTQRMQCYLGACSTCDMHATANEHPNILIHFQHALERHPAPCRLGAPSRRARQSRPDSRPSPAAAASPAAPQPAPRAAPGRCAPGKRGGPHRPP